MGGVSVTVGDGANVIADDGVNAAPDLAAFFADAPYAWSRAEKTARLLPVFRGLDAMHRARCSAYAAMAALQNPGGKIDSLAGLPAVPVQAFKRYALRSVPPADVFKTMTSSGTTGEVSRIFLDRATASIQAKALAKIMVHWLGPKRRAMLIVDTPSVLRDPKMFSARGAGILGMMNFGRDHTYALGEDLSPDVDAAVAFFEKYRDEPILIFGFTFMVWRLYEALRERGISPNLRDAVLIHAGGWKKMTELAVDNATFRARLGERLGALRVHNFYGMVEQTGSVYVECESGFFHVSNFSELILRDPVTLQPLPTGRGGTGVIETLSVLPLSYPGAAILTEDLGEVIGEDDCPCGRCGKYFEFRGRIPRAELRGCSDVYSVGK